ncbi:hypothetical protein AMTRI_Chr04g249320 [Amborella trichopoda]|uniref:very-long-chain 3-oxoacyl-CoA synthase n=1 Tax=Amborella trichopoda TaxID=13333 RepID=W1PKF5_AMBTC|nr:elongation of fatty acids protein 3-like [Amborella trichopoda]ERN07600.1 hypothetical protein AMTR_s00157p00060290 [Amborella trichopoda]|eukprot:XP_020523865.1 elongation of fatty acids protein 3-like [Amborella trichopoda]
MASLIQWLYEHPSMRKFEWSSEQTPGSSPLFVATTVLLYLSLTSLLHLLMRTLKPPLKPLSLLIPIHNLSLSSLSLLLALSAALSARTHISLHSLSHAWLFCFPQSTKPQGPVFFWAYIFYLSKIYEFTDTLIIVLKKRPITFLHVYHHALVVVMCYLWLEQVQSLMVVALVTNGLVHTFMYSYYFLCSVGFAPKWKRAVTLAQILQFVFSFCASIVMLVMHFWIDEGCKGLGAWGFNAVFNASLLLLFLNFHEKQYNAHGEGEGKGKEKKSN